MKKFTGFIAAAAIAIAPMSASALTALTDSAMNDVTGQAGVSIAIDDVVMETWVGETRYTDEGGLGSIFLPGDRTSGSATGTDGNASLVISDKHTVKFFNGFGATAAGLLHSPGINDLMVGTVDAAAQAQMGTNNAHALTIDVGYCETLSAAAAVNGEANPLVAGVVIGLPTLEIYTSSDSYTVGIAQTSSASGSPANNDGFTFIRVENGAKTQHILGGVIEIAPH